MARNLGPVCRLCRREGLKLFLKGERCFSDKCAIERRNYPPGAHGQSRTRFSEFAIRLREKQKVKRIYGLLEKQFSHYFELAERMPGITGENLLALLERRLDNVVYKLGFASSLAQGRQLARHGFFQVNGKVVTVPSYLLEVGDVIISPIMRFDCQKWLSHEPFHNAHYSSKPADPKYFATTKTLFKANQDQLPKDNKRPPQIVWVAPNGLKSSVVTTDFFGFDTSDNHYKL